MEKFNYVDDNFTGVNNISESQRILKQAISSGKLTSETEKLFSLLSEELIGLESALWARRVREKEEITQDGDLASIGSFNTAVKERTKLFTRKKFQEESDSSTLRMSSDLADNNFVKNVYENVITDTALSLRENMDSISSDPSIAQRVVLAKEAFDKVLRIISEPDISFGERGRFINELQKYVEEILPQSVISGNAGAVSFKSKLLEKIETFKKNSTSRTKQFGSWSKRKIKEEGGNLLTTGLKAAVNTPFFQILGMSGWLEKKIDNFSNPFGRKINNSEAKGIRGSFKSLSPILPKENIPDNTPTEKSSGGLIPKQNVKSSDACCRNSNKILQSIFVEMRDQNNLTRTQMRLARQQFQIDRLTKKPFEFKKQEEPKKKEDSFLETLKNLAMLLAVLPGALAALAGIFGAKSLLGRTLGKVAEKLGGVTGLGRNTSGDFNPNKENKKPQPSKGGIPPVVIPDKDGKPQPDKDNKKRKDAKNSRSKGGDSLNKNIPCMPICNELPNIGKDKDKNDKDKKDSKTNGKPDENLKRDRVGSPDVKDSKPDVKDSKPDVKDSKPDVKESKLSKIGGGLSKVGGALASGARFIPGVGLIFAGGMAAYEAANANETLGRETSAGEKAAVAAAGMIPFVDTKETAEKIISFFSSDKSVIPNVNMTRGEAKGLVNGTLEKESNIYQKEQTDLLGQLVQIQTDSLKKQNEDEQLEEVSEDSEGGEVSDQMLREQGLKGSDISSSVALGNIPAKLREKLENMGVIPKRNPNASPSTVMNESRSNSNNQSPMQGMSDVKPSSSNPMKITDDVSNFYRSSTASEKGLSNVPEKGSIQESNSKYSQGILNNMQQKVFGGKMVLTSGFRSQEVNMAVGGKVQSDHQQGLAADIQVPGMSPMQVAQKVASSGVPFDKLIVEPSWVHVSFPKQGQKPKYHVFSMDKQISSKAVQQNVSVNTENSASFLQAQAPQTNVSQNTGSNTVAETSVNPSQNLVVPSASQTNVNQPKQQVSLAPVTNDQQMQKMETMARNQSQGAIDLTDSTISKLAQTIASIAKGNTIVNNSSTNTSGSGKSSMTTQSPVSVDRQTRNSIT